MIDNFSISVTLHFTRNNCSFIRKNVVSQNLIDNNHFHNFKCLVISYGILQCSSSVWLYNTEMSVFYVKLTHLEEPATSYLFLIEISSLQDVYMYLLMFVQLPLQQLHLLLDVLPRLCPVASDHVLLYRL